MKVDVIRIRVRGEKLSADLLRGAQATRGDLTIRSRLEGDNGSVLLALLSGGPRFELLLPALDFVQIGSLRGDEFILRGNEEIVYRKRGRHLRPELVVQAGPSRAGLAVRPDVQR